jgi:hypothetical protein
LSDFVVPKPCPSKGLADVVMSAENSSNGRAVGTAFEEFDLGDLVVGDIDIFVEELTAETLLRKKTRSSMQWSLLVVVANSTGFLFSSANERDSIVSKLKKTKILFTR